MVTLKIDSGLYEIDLSCLQASGYLKEAPGREPYKLLAYLSQQLPAGAKVADIGTFQGDSAVALAFNPQVRVLSCDTVQRPHPTVANIDFVHGDCFNMMPQFLDCDLISFDISPHDGQQERKFLDQLVQLKYRGVVVWDDINYSDGMRQFWKSIVLRKFDVSAVGHHSGTGVTVFDPEHLDGAYS